MSTTQSQPQPSASQTTASPRAQAERLFDQLFTEPGLCPVCFATKRTYYPEYDSAVAEHLHGTNRAALEAAGHRVDDEGGLMVNRATSDADPNTYQEVVPPRTDTYGQILELPRPKTICECGVIDFDCDDDHRTKKQLYDGIENIAEHIEERDDTAFDLDAAKEVVRQATKVDSLAGHDRRILIGAIELGIKMATANGNEHD